MTSITLEFTEEQYDRIRRFAEANRFADAGDYIRSLVDIGLDLHSIEGLEEKLKEGFESELSDWNPRDLEDIRALRPPPRIP